jgi:hypothetical protein
MTAIAIMGSKWILDVHRKDVHEVIEHLHTDVYKVPFKPHSVTVRITVDGNLCRFIDDAELVALRLLGDHTFYFKDKTNTQ